jgi:hypothetical protein
MKSRGEGEAESAGNSAAAEQAGGVDLRQFGLMRRMRERRAASREVPHRSEMEQRFGQDFS